MTTSPLVSKMLGEACKNPLNGKDNCKPGDKPGKKEKKLPAFLQKKKKKVAESGMSAMARKMIGEAAFPGAEEPAEAPEAEAPEAIGGPEGGDPSPSGVRPHDDEANNVVGVLARDWQSGDTMSVVQAALELPPSQLVMLALAIDPESIGQFVDLMRNAEADLGGDPSPGEGDFGGEDDGDGETPSPAPESPEPSEGGDKPAEDDKE